ncbi:MULTISPECIES: winged helix-turn-helix domain-containing protein [unclassified Phaeobacter]|uniref:winged helix-turn-helix domain-containing protein n=1 Tax=unclassified Phaeobacter TaxID=2621772 RepID=UPI003A83C4AA
MSKPWRGVDLGQLVAAGKTTGEIAYMAGSSTGAVRCALARRGLSPNLPKASTVRRIAEGMPPREAVEYLLGVLEEVAPAVSGDPSEIDDWGVDWTSSQRLIVSTLFAASPEAVPSERLWSLLYAARPGCDGPDEKIIGVYICKIRKRLPSEHGQIVTYWGRGYAFEPADQGVAGTPPTAAQEGATGHA